MKRRKIKVNNILLFVFIISLFGIFIYLNNNKNNNYKEPDKIINNNIQEEEKTQIYKSNLIMVGDALVHDRLYNDAYKNGIYDFKPYLKYIKEEVSKYDLAYYNQETILGGTDIGLSSYPSFNSPQELGDAMIDTGFNLVSLATNHTLDRGEIAIKNSRNYWNSKKDVYAFGSYISNEEKNDIENTIITKNNITFGFLNYTYGTNGIPVPYNKDYLVNLWDDTKNYEGYKETVKNDIAKLRNKVDVLIVMMHWGREYTHTPTNLEKETAKFLAEQNVDIIIGTHPHVIQPIEWIDNTLVFYSLGNFISAQTSSSCSNYKCNIGLMSSLDITKTIDKDNVSIKIDNINNDLIYTYHNNYKDYMVIPFSNNDIKNYLSNYKDIYNQYSGIIESSDERITTKESA